MIVEENIQIAQKLYNQRIDNIVQRQQNAKTIECKDNRQYNTINNNNIMQRQYSAKTIDNR